MSGGGGGESLPSQTSNNGKFLTTNGTVASWATVDKTTVGLSNVENTALSTWSGSSSITTVGTLANLTVTNTITGSISGNAGTVTNGVYTSGTYSDPSWITSLSKSKVGLGNVENTALTTWSGSTSITSLGTIGTGTWQGSVISDSYIDSAIARLASPTFTGTVVLPSSTSIGSVSSTEIGYLDGVTSSVQTQINSINTEIRNSNILQWMGVG